MILKNLSSKYLKKENNSYIVFKQTIFYLNAYFVSHIFWLKTDFYILIMDEKVLVLCEK